MKRLLLTILALVAMTTGSQAQNIHDGHKYVNLGLPSGTMWATCNIGAEAPERMGDKFAWGETEPKELSTWQNYKFGTPIFLTKYVSERGWPYNDNKMELDDMDDAAQVNWGGTWRMPTLAQFYELSGNCTIQFSFEDVGNNKKRYGVLFTSNINGNSIFFPVTDYVDADWKYKLINYGVEYCTKDRNDTTPWGETWAYSFYFILINGGRAECWEESPQRYEANPIRPVFVEGDVAPTHTHSYTSNWRMNANMHWHPCESPLGVCDATKYGEAAHTFDSNNNCTVCGYTTNHEMHYYSDDWVWFMDANTHWHPCETPYGTCDAPKKDEHEHEYGSHEEYIFCTTCRYQKPIPHTHSYATTWSWNETTHWHACTSELGYCDTPKADESEHSFDANKICTVCGYEGYMEYGFSVYLTKVTSKNKNDILGNGVFSYLPETKTLSVRGNHLSPRYGNILVNESVEGLVVNISGNVTLSALTGFLSHSDMTITGPGHLTVSTQMTTTDMMDGSKLVIKDIAIDAECDKWGIAGEMAETLVIQNSTIKAKGPSGAICDFDGGITLTGCKIIEPVGGYVKNGDVVDASGNLATEVFVARNGDANLDGVVDIADVVAVLNAMANDLDAPQFKVNDDNVVDIADVVAVLNIMAQQ